MNCKKSLPDRGVSGVWLKCMSGDDGAETYYILLVVSTPLFSNMAGCNACASNCCVFTEKKNLLERERESEEKVVLTRNEDVFFGRERSCKKPLFKTLFCKRGEKEVKDQKWND